MSDKKALLDQVAMYEQILERMPKDEFSLESLLDLYKQLEDDDKAQEIEERLQALKEGTSENEHDVLAVLEEKEDRLAKMDVQSATINKLSRNVVMQKPKVKDPVMLAWRKETERPDDNQLNIQLTFADFNLYPSVEVLVFLYKEELISEESYLRILSYLKKKVFAEFPVLPSTVFHELIADNIDGQKLADFMSEYSGYDLYENDRPFDRRYLNYLPLWMVMYEGVLILEKTNGKYCIGVLNPLNIKIMAYLEEFLNHQCDFVTLTVEQFNDFLNT